MLEIIVRTMIPEMMEATILRLSPSSMQSHLGIWQLSRKPDMVLFSSDYLINRKNYDTIYEIQFIVILKSTSPTHHMSMSMTYWLVEIPLINFLYLTFMKSAQIHNCQNHKEMALKHFFRLENEQDYKLCSCRKIRITIVINYMNINNIIIWNKITLDVKIPSKTTL
jgi:hypothetical protein